MDCSIPQQYNYFTIVKLDSVPYEDLLKIESLATQEGETIHQMAVDYTAEDIANSLLAFDQYINYKILKITKSTRTAQAEICLGCFIDLFCIKNDTYHF